MAEEGEQVEVPNENPDTGTTVNGMDALREKPRWKDVVTRAGRMWGVVRAVMRLSIWIRPHGTRRMWDYSIFLVCLYCWIVVPLRVGFYLQQTLVGLIVDFLFDYFLWMDIALNFFTAFETDDDSVIKGKEKVYSDEEGGRFVLVTQLKQIFKNYLSSRVFYYDILASFPLDFIAMSWSSTIYVHPAYRLNRLFRLARFGYYFHVFQRHYSTLSPSIVRIMKFLVIVFLIVHWTSCCFFFVVQNEENKGEPACEDFVDSSLSSKPLHSKYIFAFYWSVVSLTGYGNTEPCSDMETTLYVLVTIIGVMIYVTLVGIVASLVASLDSSSSSFRGKLEGLRNLMTFRNIPDKLQKSVFQYYYYIWSSRKGMGGTEAIHDLPTYLRMEISLFLNKEVINKVSLFSKADTHFISAVVTRLHPRVVLPGFYVVRRGEVGKEMFFIVKGNVEILNQNGEVVAKLTEGSFFGEVALLFSGKRNADVRARTFCDLFVLTKEDFDVVVSDFPEQAKFIRKEAEWRMKEMEEHAAKRNEE